MLQSPRGASGEQHAASAPRRDAPPLLLDLGVRDDREARELRRALGLYQRGRRAAARRLFARHDSLNAQVALAVAAWPEGTTARLRRLSTRYPRSALVHANLGIALFWEGRRAEAVTAWRAAVRVEPDSPAAVRADDFLHPRYAPGLPQFVPSFAPPASLRRLPPARQLRVLRDRARAGSGDRQTPAYWKILYGVALQRVGRPVSAERAFAAAAAAAPRDPEAQVAAAVARFRKSRPARGFARLGPLTRRFPHSPTVRYHLGLLLLWIGRVDEAERQLERAIALGPRSPLGGEARRLLRRVQEARKQ